MNEFAARPAPAEEEARASEPTVYVVDDDGDALAALLALVRSLGLQAKGYPSAASFLADLEPRAAGCLITDVRMEGMDGLELQAQLAAQGCELPVVLITAYPMLRAAVQALRRGASTYLEKPCAPSDLETAIREALARDARRRQARQQRLRLEARFATLDDAEREVLELLAEGLPNKSIARRLDISLRTVESRRRRIFLKTGVDSLAVLTRLFVAWRYSD